MLVRHSFQANAQQRSGSSPDAEPSVWVEAIDVTAFPPGLTRLGREKVRFLIESVGPLPRDAVTLELFGGSGLSTAVIAAHLDARRRLVTVDLHAALSHRAAWRYVTEVNWPALEPSASAASSRGSGRRPGRNDRRSASPLFLAADAAQLPLADGVFDAVVLTDSPRTAADRMADPAGGSAEAGRETHWSASEQAGLFRQAVAESRRVLRPGGLILATAPVTWTVGLEASGWDRVLRLSGAPVDEAIALRTAVTVRPMAARHRFRTEGVCDPVVYLRAIRS